MSTADVARSERVLNAIGSRVGLTECGRDWLIASVDPYHDTPLNVTGYPDTNEAASVVQVIKLSSTLVAPGSANWDAHIHQFPWLGSTGNPQTKILAGTDSGSTFTITGSPTQSNTYWTGLSIDCVPSASPTFHYTNTTITQPFNSALQPYLSNEFRVIAMGFEVINTTTDVNIQGLVTTYRYPMPDLDSAKTLPIFQSNTNALALGFQDVLRTVAPPDTPNTALLLEGSRQWKAKEGCYCVGTLNSSEIPTGVNNCGVIIGLSPTDPIYAGSQSAISTPTNAGTSTIPSSPAFSLTVFGAPESNMTKFNHFGAYFSGLSAATTLQVNTIYIVERFPTSQETDLVVLAKPSCRADHAALELYSEVSRMMPVGVPQRMNGLGEWFSDAVSAASDFISPALSAIPHPYAQMAGAALKTGSGIVKKLVGGQEQPAGKTYTPTGMVSAPKKTVPVAHKAKPGEGKKKKK